MLVRVERHELGPRCYLAGARIHHGLTGLLLLTAGVATRHPALVAAGALAVWHDRRDFPFPLHDPPIGGTAHG
jgi:hypothetical protein